MLKKVLIIHPEGNSFYNPTTKCVIDLLRDQEVDVHILYQKRPTPMPSYREVKHHSRKNPIKIIKKIFLTRVNADFTNLLISFFEYLILPKNFDLIVGIDREGVIEASLLSKLLDAPYVFFSFEIMFSSETTRRFKKIEIKASQSASKWFVQDAERSKFLQQENQLDPNRGVKLPLASKGAGQASSVRLRDDLDIPKAYKVAMCMGSLANWSMTPEIILSVKNWPENWCLIIHSSYGETRKEFAGFGTDIKSLIDEKIFISETPIDMVDELSWLLSGVDAGLAFYKPQYSTRFTGKNLECLGLASGKISAYLRYGVPVIMNQIGTYSKLAEEYGFGVSIKKVSEISSALLICEQQDFSHAARDFFCSHLDFALYQDLVRSELNGVASAK